MASSFKVVDFANADKTLSDQPGRYFGFSARETAGAAANFKITDGENGTILDSVNLAANGFAHTWYGPQGLPVENSVFYDYGTGSVEGSGKVS